MTEVSFRSDMSVELVDAMGDESSIVRAARVSTLGAGAEREEAAGLIRYLVREGHTSPLEHTALTFRLEVPLFVQNQLVRHRAGVSFNIESGRYRELEPVFYLPARDRPVRQVGKTGDYRFEHDEYLTEAADSRIRWASGEAWKHYESLLHAGAAKEVARMVLPLNIYSTIYLTLNLHAALHLVRLRTLRYGSKPQHEVALVGEAIRDVLARRFPVVLDAFDHSQAVV